MAKSLVKNSIANVFYKSLNILFPLITATYTSRVLMAAGIGKVSYAQNIVSYFVMFAALGMPSYGTREIAKLKEKNKNILFSELFTINAISTLLFSLAYIILINSVGIFASQIKLYYAVGLTLFLNIFNIDWYYQGEEEYGYIAIRGFIIKVISLLCVFTFVRTSNDFLVYALITALGTVGNNVINVAHLKGKVTWTWKNLNLKQHLKPLLILTASAVAIELYTAMDITMLGIMCTDVEVGYYSNAIKIVKLLEAVISALGAILLPRLSYYYSDGKTEQFNKLVDKALRTLLLLAIPTGFGVFCVSDLMIPLLFGESFLGSINTLRILSLTLPILVINVLFGIQCLITMGKEKKYLVTVSLGAITNLILNPILIILHKQEGAAFASLLSESVVAISTIIFVKKYLTIKLEKKYVITLILSAILMVLGVSCIKLIHTSLILKLFISVFTGVVIYIETLMLTKNQTAQEIFYLLKEKICNKIKTKIVTNK